MKTKHRTLARWINKLGACRIPSYIYGSTIREAWAKAPQEHRCFMMMRGGMQNHATDVCSDKKGSRFYRRVPPILIRNFRKWQKQRR